MTSSENPKVGFVGFGEAGYYIAKGLLSAGISKIRAFDLNADSHPAGEKIRKRFKCVEVKTGKLYLFSGMYEVNVL